MYRGKRISKYSDLSADTRKQRDEFKELRLNLRKLSIRCGFIYPAKLILTFQDKTFIFFSLEEAQEFYDKNIKSNLDEETDVV